MQDWYLELGNNAYPYIIVIGVVIAVIAAFYYRRTVPDLPPGLKIFLFALRALSILLIALLLCFPTIVYTDQKPTGSKLAVLIDNSGSIGFSDGDSSRADRIRRFVEDNGINQEAGRIIFTFTDTLARMDTYDNPAPESSLTDIGGAIRNVMRENAYTSQDRPLDIGGILLISDGAATTGPDPVFEAVRTGLPVSAVGLGDTTKIPDIAIDNIRAPEIVYRGEEIDFDLLLKSDFDRSVDALLELYRGVRRYESRKVSLPGGGSVKEIRISVPADSVGHFNYKFTLKGDFKEHFTGNNTRSKSVQVLKDRLKILLAGEKPGWEFTFLKRILESNDKYEVSPVLPLAGQAGKGGRTILGSYPVHPGDYDCVVLVGCGNNIYNRLGSDMIKMIETGNLSCLLYLSSETPTSRFDRILTELGLKKGRQRIFAAGGEFIPEVVNSSIPDPLLRLPKGDYNRIFSSMPPLRYRLIGLDTDDDWEIVINSYTADDRTTMPLLMRRARGGNAYASRDRIVVFNGGPLWRWDLYAKRSATDDSSYGVMIDNIVSYLTVGGQIEPIEVSTDRNLYDSGSEVLFNARVFDENYHPLDESAVLVSLRKKGGEEFGLELRKTGDGIFEGGAGRVSPGNYDYTARVTVAGDTVRTLHGTFTVQQFSEEFRTVAADRNILREIAEATGGVYLDIEDRPSEPFPLKSGVITEKKAASMASLSVILIVLIILLALEWAVRKRKQLL
jgi:hypothetical protein